ncbi:MAG: S9 family peptidase, partial [Flavobacteriales bacterium]|nr:S9 family peptidase [Flavobacteriales bacterium]
MKNVFIVSSLLIFAACGNQNNESVSPTRTITAPVAEKIDHEMTIHDHTRNDEYYWMNERDAPKVLDYLNAENAYTKANMAHTEGLQKDLFAEMKGRIKENDESLPYKENGYYYITRFEKGKEYAIYTRKKETLEAPEELLIDANVLAKGNEFFSIAEVECSPNNEIVAYGFDTQSRRLWTIHFKNLLTGEIYKDELLNTDGSVAWANDSKTVFYAVKDTVDLRPGEIWKHTLGTPQSEDVLVYTEEDNTFYAEVYRTKSNDYLVIAATSTLTSEYQYISADDPDSDWHLFHARERGLEYHISHYKDQFYIRTNLDALNFKLMSCSINATGKSNWKEVIPHRSDVLFEGVEIFKNFMVLEERANGLTGIRVINQSSGEDHYIEFNDEAYVAYSGNNFDFDTETLRYSYSSLTTPWTIYDYNMLTKDQDLMKQQEVVGDYDPSKYESKRFMAKADDGTAIPISIVYKKGLELNGKNPTVLYAYGSYGSSTDPTFNPNRISLLERGFIWAIAHIRGGEEMGRQWYDYGKLLKK